MQSMYLAYPKPAQLQSTYSGLYSKMLPTINHKVIDNKYVGPHSDVLARFWFTQQCSTYSVQHLHTGEVSTEQSPSGDQTDPPPS